MRPGGCVLTCAVSTGNVVDGAPYTVPHWGACRGPDVTAAFAPMPQRLKELGITRKPASGRASPANGCSGLIARISIAIESPRSPGVVRAAAHNSFHYQDNGTSRRAAGALCCPPRPAVGQYPARRRRSSLSAATSRSALPGVAGRQVETSTCERWRSTVASPPDRLSSAAPAR